MKQKIYEGVILYCSCFLLTIGLMTACRNTKELGENRLLKEGFYTPSDSVQLSTYWYWINGNISEEGVAKDLESMKKSGIGRAFIGNIGLSQQEGTSQGNVKLFSEEWWNILRTAFVTAKQEGVDIGMFNGPGWSQSGGPWVKPSEAMRYLAHTETYVEGPVSVHQQLPIPDSNFQRTSVIAFQSVDLNEAKMADYAPRVISVPQIARVQNLVDGDIQSAVSFSTLSPSDTSLSINLELNGDMTVRSLLLYPSRQPFKADVSLQVKEDHDYRTIRTFEFDRSNASKSVGFIPFGPVAISFPAVKSREFRLVFSHMASRGGLSEIVLSPVPYLERYVEKQLGKMFQTPLPLWDAYQWRRQAEYNEPSLVVHPDSVIDITKYTSSDGMLDWKVPQGNWTIMQLGMLPTGVTNAPAAPEGTGLEVDKMNKESVSAHFDSFVGKILNRIPAADREAFKYVVADSYETGSENWTDGFSHDFQERYGYNPLPWLPVLSGRIVGSADQSDRFLWDLRRLIADRVAYSYVGGLRDISHQHGLNLWLENYGHWGFPAEFLQYGGQSDEVGGEFWAEGDLGSIELKAASSAAHIYGKNKVSAESFTASGMPFQRYPGSLKKRADWAFTQGVNNTLLHVNISQPSDTPVPGVNAWFGTEFNRKNTWFEEGKLFFDYLRRCMYLLQQGQPVVDVAYYIGEDAPKMTGVRNPELPDGYAYDYINAEVIKNRLSVKDGKIMLPEGISYSLLVLPPENTMRPEVLKKIGELVSQGAVVMGSRPERSPSMQGYPFADEEVKKLAAEIWQNCDGKTVKMVRYGKGMVLDGMRMEETFGLLKVNPDFRTKTNGSILYAHRRTVDTDIYFISNQTDTTVSVSPVFRISDKRPEWWDATDGSTRELPQYTQNEDGVTVPLKLEPYESGFVVFRNKGGDLARSGDNFPGGTVVSTIDGSWQVTFDTAMRGPDKPVIFQHLEDWSKRPEDAIRHYSGSAVYRSSFTIPEIPQGAIYLDLGSAKAMAHVTLNGKDVGGVWTYPWRVDITGAIKKGENELAIKITNTWVNRLIGDSKLPPEMRKTHADINNYNPESPLDPSGLYGPVTIKAVGQDK